MHFFSLNACCINGELGNFTTRQTKESDPDQKNLPNSWIGVIEILHRYSAA